MDIDLDSVSDAFAASTDFTVGIEEEFAILDPDSLDLVPRFEELRDTAEPELRERIAGELIMSELEIVSGRGERAARTAPPRARVHSAAVQMASSVTKATIGAAHRPTDQPNTPAIPSRRK